MPQGEARKAAKILAGYNYQIAIAMVKSMMIEKVMDAHILNHEK